MGMCVNCGFTPIRKGYKYCSNNCQLDFQYKQYIQKWKSGLVSGSRGIRFHNISQHIKKYLIQKNGEKCSQCGWNKKHPKSGMSPLEVDHIDGNADNNMEKNLSLLCPNCHSLTLNFRNFNKGKGRIWRQVRLQLVNNK